MYGRSRRAFTFTELLVAIAILAILASILFPVLARGVAGPINEPDKLLPVSTLRDTRT